MSKEIDLTKPLSEFDLRYLVDRNRWDDIRKNAEHLGRDVPALPSVRGLRAQVPRRELANSDNFDKIAEQLGVTRTNDTLTEQEFPAPPPVVPTAGAQAPVGPVDTSAKRDEPVDYNKLTVPQLKEELDKRRKEYEEAGDSDAVADVSYSNDDRKDDLVAKLELDDEASDGDDGDS